MGTIQPHQIKGQNMSQFIPGIYFPVYGDFYNLGSNFEFWKDRMKTNQIQSG